MPKAASAPAGAATFIVPRMEALRRIGRNHPERWIVRIVREAGCRVFRLDLDSFELPPRGAACPCAALASAGATPAPSASRQARRQKKGEPQPIIWDCLDEEPKFTFTPNEDHQR